MFTVTTAKLTGLPGVSGWSQVYEFSPNDPEKVKNLGKVYAVVSTNNAEDGIDTINSGRKLFSRFNEEYFNGIEDKPFNLLKKATERVGLEFAQVWGNVEIISVAVIENIAYSAVCGGGSVMILRDGVLVRILSYQPEKVTTASGYLKINDTLLLATQSFFEKFPLGVIKASLMAPSPSAGIESFTPLIHSGEEFGNVGAILMKLHEQKTEFEDKKIVSEVINPVPEPPIYKNKIESKVRSLISKFSLKIPRKTIYVKQTLTEDVSPQSKKITFSIAIILLILLAVSIGFGIRQKRINDNKNKYLGILEEAKGEVDQAISLASVSSERSRQLFIDAQQKIASIDKLDIKDSELTALKQKINESRAAILGEYDIEPEMFLDLTLLSSGFKGDAMAFSGGQIYVMDTAGKRIISVNSGTKKSKVVAGPGVITEAKSMACYEDRVFVLESDGVYQVGSSNQKMISKTWSGDAIITAFAGNIYVLDKSGNSIYRYQGVGNSFGDKQNWLAPGTNVNFSNVTQISVDGSIYALYPNSKVLKFSQGSPLNFNVTGTVPQIGNIYAINTSPDNQNIYLLDKAGKRVVVTDKKGVYKAQYVNELIGNSINIVVSEKDSKIILLTGDKLYSLDIKN